MMGKALILGHKNPDTDSICSAIAYAELKSKLGADVEPVRLGDVNAETQFVLETFQVEAPRLVETVANEVNEVILVDHNERQQSASDITEVEVLEVIDHHRIANFETSNPLYYRAEPVGCTATILNKLFKEHVCDSQRDCRHSWCPPLCRIPCCLSHRLAHLKTWKRLRELAEIADVNVERYGLQMLKAGADLSDKTAQQLISLDAKEFPMGDYKVEIAQVNTVDVNDVLSRQSELESVVREGD